LKTRQAILWVLTAGLMLAACRSDKLTVEDILAQSSAAMSEIETVQFTIEREGEPVPIELAPGTVVSLVGLRGSYQAPETVFATVKIEAMGQFLEADLLWLPESAYYRMVPFVPDFQAVDLSAFDVSNIFSGPGSVPDVMAGKLLNPTLIGEEDLEGIPTYHVQAEAASQDLTALLGWALMSDTATVDLWIDRGTMEVVRILATEPDGSAWQIDIFSYGEPVEIPTP
jgi:hypothetical protein